jgi:Ca-activated chloride channel family protein
MKFTWPQLLLVLGGLGALGQPRWGVDENATRQHGVDLLVCLDVSRSMLARDVTPNRLDRARAELQNLAQGLGADRVGLILVAGEARRAAPLSADHASFLSLLELASPQSVRQGGTNLASALSKARQLLEAAPTAQRNVLLVTDGEDRAGLALQEAKRCAEDGVVVHTLAVGSEAGSKITITSSDGRESFLKDEAGREVLSKLDFPSLQKLSQETGGEVIRLQREVGVLQSWYEHTLLPQARLAAVGDPNLERANRYQIPLGLALCGAAVMLAGYGRRRK